MEQFAIYLWSISENVQTLLVAMGLMTAFTGPMLACAVAATNSEDFPKKDALRCITIGAITIGLSVFIPAKQDLALIFAYPYLKAGVQNVAQSETISKLQTAASKYLDKIIADLDKAGAAK